jgi:hypothetical protein
MSINLSRPGLDARRKKKIIRERLHLFNWNKVSEESEWIWVPIESEGSIVFFAQWISKQYLMLNYMRFATLCYLMNLTQQIYLKQKKHHT